MNVALSFNIENGHITARKGLVRDFDGYYERISHADEKRLLKLLEDFYQKSDSDWYDSFFGPRKNSSFKIHLCIITGPANYAARQRYEDGTEKVCAVMGCCDRNNEGRIFYGVHYTLPVIIHECNHSYCNPLNEEVWDKIKDKSTEIYFLLMKNFAGLALAAGAASHNERLRCFLIQT